MFLPHNHNRNPGNSKTTHTPSTHVPDTQNKQKKSNDDYIAFIRSNHNMIEKHFLNDFEHPYKQSLLKSNGMGNYESDARKISKQETGNSQHCNSLFTLQHTPQINGKQSSSLKLHHSTNIEKMSRKHEIINSLNFTKPSVTNSLINSNLAPAYRYTSNNPNTKAPISKEEILALLDEKNKEISTQLMRQRNNFSEIVYQAKHHSQSNMGRAGNSSHESQRRLEIERNSVGSKEMRSLQRLRKQQTQLSAEKPNTKEGDLNSHEKPQKTQRTRQRTNGIGQKAQVYIEKFERYSQQNAKGKYGLQYYQQSQNGQNNGNVISNNSNTFALPAIKNRSQPYTHQQFPEIKMSENPSVPVSENELIASVYSKSSKPSTVSQSNSHNQKHRVTQNNLSASINQLRKQFQQNSDAIKIYKKVQKNNNALKVRQINQKNLKSYYEYENAIIKNTHFSMIQEELKKNITTMKQLKPSKTNAKISSGDHDYFNTLLEQIIIEKQDNSISPNTQKYITSSKSRMSEEEMFIKEIIADKKNTDLKVLISKNLSPGRKSIRYLPSPAQLEQELTGMKDNTNAEDNNQEEEGQPLSERNSSTLSPSKQRKPQPKNHSLSIVPVVTKADSTVYELKVRGYRQFAFKIYFAHKKFNPLIIRELPSTLMRPEEKYKFNVGRGNNSLLIKSLMKRRFWWTWQEDPKKANFVWTQLKINSLYEFQKKSEVINLHYKCEDIPGDQSPQTTKRTKKKYSNKEDQVKEKKTFIFKAPLPQDDDMKVLTEFDKKLFGKLSTALADTPNPEKLDNFEKRLGYFPETYLESIVPQGEHTESFSNICSQETTLSSKNPQISFLKTVRMHNHFQFNHFIGNKKALFYNLRYYYQLTNRDVYDIIPLTFHIRQGLKDPEYAKFLKCFRAIEKKSKSYSKSEKDKQEKDKLNELENKPKKEKNIWIIKPGQNSNRGNGIQVFDELYELNNILKKKDTNKDKNNQPHTYIVQKYIEKPLLYKNRKFDIRHYFVLTRLWGKMRAYFFGEGYIRTASYQYDLGNVGDTQIHLTNDAIQKHCDSYGKYEEGNKLSYVEFQRYLDTVAKEEQTKAYNSSNKKSQTYEKKPISFANDIYPQMRNIAIQAIRACYIQMDPNKTEHNFQVFGMDFMIDKDFKVWLIEINTNPCLQLSSKLLERVIPTMVEQSLRLTIDVVFPPPYHYPNTMKHMMPDYSLEKLKCELIFDEDRDGKELEEMFNRQLQIDKKEGRKSIREMLLGEIDQEDETYDNDGKEINLGEKGGVEVEE